MSIILHTFYEKKGFCQRRLHSTAFRGNRLDCFSIGNVHIHVLFDPVYQAAPRHLYRWSFLSVSYFDSSYPPIDSRFTVSASLISPCFLYASWPLWLAVKRLSATDRSDCHSARPSKRPNTRACWLNYSETALCTALPTLCCFAGRALLM